MLSIVIATYESERALVPTLSALVPGATGGLISEVVLADAGSSDATEEVADIAGCRFMRTEGSLGARLKQAAISTRAPWLMFLRAGCVPDPAWVAATERFMEATASVDGQARAAVFRPGGADDPMRPRLSEVLAMIGAMLGGGVRPEQGLLIARQFYDALGGHPEGSEAEAGILRRLGRRRVTMLGAGARHTG